jgi:phosphate transport system protein
MSRHLQIEIDKLKRSILALGALVEEDLQRALRAVAEKDPVLAQRVIDADREIDQFEVDVEEECLKILALHQPAAVDLRFIVAVMKLNGDLERIGDLAVNIAEQAIALAASRSSAVVIDLAYPLMGEKAQWMLRRSLDALVNQDSRLARQVCAGDDDVDALNREVYDQVVQGIGRHPGAVDQLIRLLDVAHHLERIADHATNIAEDVVYLVEGVIVRHQGQG